MSLTRLFTNNVKNKMWMHGSSCLYQKCQNDEEEQQHHNNRLKVMTLFEFQNKYFETSGLNEPGRMSLPYFLCVQTGILKYLCYEKEKEPSQQLKSISRTLKEKN